MLYTLWFFLVLKFDNLSEYDSDKADFGKTDWESIFCKEAKAVNYGWLC
jgi:hypothetical protein